MKLVRAPLPPTAAYRARARAVQCKCGGVLVWQAARAIDARLKQDPCQSVCHGDAKGANILYASEGAACVPLVYDFQYCGKACVTKE
eukprot:6591192-Prymnesium_polylepis.1